MKYYSHYYFLFLAIIVFTSGCKENGSQTNSSVISTRDELTDPNVTPEVIWTFPTNNSTGPFSTYNTTSHHFIVQFNKLMNLYSFTSSTVKIKGFDTKVTLSLNDYNSSSQQFQNVIKFYIRNASNGNIMSFQVGKTYEVEIDSTIEDIHGKRLQKKYSFSFTPEPSFRVRYAYPLDGDTISFNDYYYPSNVYLSFNSPIATTGLSSLHITPDVNGKWTFDQGSQNIAYFVPTTGFNFSTQYQIYTDQNFADKYGNVLAQPFSSTFNTGLFKVTATSPVNGAENVSIYSGNQIYIALSGTVDATTTSSAFTISPSIQGNISTSGSQLYFYPSEQLTPGTKYTITIGTQLKAKNGTMLSSPYTFYFTTEDFRVTSTEPYQGSSGISPNSQIRFSFNSPIDPASALSAMSITPAVSGSFSFLYYDNRTFTFIPTQPLKLGTQYTVTLSSSMKSIAGAALKEKYEFQFTTAPFQVSYTNPSNGSYYITASSINVWFTADLDTGSVRNSFSISPSITGNFSFSTNQFTFFPTTPFAAGKKYSIILSTGVKSIDGAPLQSPYTFSFITQPFQITSVSPSAGNTDIYRSSSIYVYTNYIVDQTSAASAFSISPAVAGTVYPNGYGFYFTPQNQYAASTVYTFTVSTKLKSINGDTLMVGQSSSFKTGL